MFFWFILGKREDGFGKGGVSRSFSPSDRMTSANARRRAENRLH